MVAILHIELFVTFAFDPLLFQDLLMTPIWTISNEFSRINWRIIGLQYFFLFQVLPYALADILGRCVRCCAEIRGKNKGKVKIRRDSKT